MYKVNNLKRKSMSWAQNFRKLKEGLHILLYASQEYSGMFWVMHVFLERE